MCSTLNVYMFVYILIGTHMVPLTISFQVFTVWYGISCSFLVIITHSCCALVCYYHQKAHSIPYHTVNTWNSVVNPSGFLSTLQNNMLLLLFRRVGGNPYKTNLWKLQGKKLNYVCIKHFVEHSTICDSRIYLICVRIIVPIMECA